MAAIFGNESAHTRRRRIKKKRVRSLALAVTSAVAAKGSPLCIISAFLSHHRRFFLAFFDSIAQLHHLRGLPIPARSLTYVHFFASICLISIP